MLEDIEKQLLTYNFSGDSLSLYLHNSSVEPYLVGIKKIAGSKNDSSLLYNEVIDEKIKEICLLIKPYLEDHENISYVLLTSPLIEKSKMIFENNGFIASYYTDDQLKELFPKKSKREREEYKSYAVITRRSILETTKKEKNIPDDKKKVLETNNRGYIINDVLILTGVSILCFLFVQLAIKLIK